ncbi:hypothetical protein DH09_10070 [Bacillaceae bacterium JMAK1]|nr:hypothetical protein DH09_10070 [Bacillaceae bacterium JMAK1]
MAYQPKSYRKFIAGTMTAAMAASAFAVTTPQQVADAQEQTFSDVDASNPHFENIERAADRGVITGYSDGTYQPNTYITRGQIATMIVRAFDLEVPENPTRLYDDVSENHHFADVVQAVSEAGIMVGRFDNTVFEPGAQLSRQQMASILVRAFELENIPGDDTVVEDIELAYESHVENILILAQHGITSTSDNTFRPSASVTRGQLASFLERSIEVKHTIDSGLEDIQAINNTTVDVYFEDSVVDVDAEDFAFTGLDVVDAEVVAGPEGNNNVVRLTTASQEEGAEYKLVYQGEYTTLTFEGTVAEATTPVEVTSVEDITTEGVTVEIEEPGESLIDASVNVTDPNGNDVEVVAQDIDADATEATFAFANELPFVQAGTWIVNGAEYEVEFNIDNIAALDRAGQAYEVTFNSTVDSLSQSNIRVSDATTGELRGIQSVDLHDDGHTATITFLDEAHLEAHRDYTFTVNISGYSAAQSTHQRPAYLENARVVGYDADDETIEVEGERYVNGSLEAHSEQLNASGIDYEEALGTSGVFSYLRNNDIVQFNQNENESVVYGAITEVDSANNTATVHVDGEDVEYNVASSAIHRLDGSDEDNISEADYSKVVLSGNNIVFTNAYNWSPDVSPLLVSSVDEDGIVYGLADGEELDASDYTIVNGGQTVSPQSLSTGDLLFFNTNEKYAEVYTERKAGTIETIYSDSFVVDGVEYDLSDDIYYVDAEGNRSTITSSVLEDLEEVGEPVVLYLDRSGELAFVVGDLGEVVLGENGAYLTSNGNAYSQGTNHYLQLEYRDVSGGSNEIELQLNDVEELAGVESEYGFGVANEGTGATIQPLNEDGELTGDPVRVSGENGIFASGNVIELLTDDDAVVGTQTVPSGTYTEADTTPPADERVRPGQRIVEIEDEEENDINIITPENTPVFLYDGDGYQGVTTWGEVEADFVKELGVYYDSELQTSTYLTLDLRETEGESVTTEETAVINDVRYNTEDELVQVSAFVNGEIETYSVDELLNDEGEQIELPRGAFVELELDNDDVVVAVNEYQENIFFRGLPTSFQGANSFILDGEGDLDRLRLSEDAYILDATGNSLTTARFNDLREVTEDGNHIEVVLAAEGVNVVDYVIIHEGSAPGQEPEEPEATFTVSSVQGNGDLPDLTVEGTLSELEDLDSEGVAFALEDEDDVTLTVEEFDNEEGEYTATVSVDGDLETDAEYTLVTEIDGVVVENFLFDLNEDSSDDNGDDDGEQD